MLLCMDWGVDVALRLSYQTPPLRTINIYEKSGSECWSENVGRWVMGWENRFLCSQIFAVIYLAGLGLNRTPGDRITKMLSSALTSI